MQNFQDTFETHKQSFISAFLIYLTAPLSQEENTWLTGFWSGKICIIHTKVRNYFGKCCSNPIALPHNTYYGYFIQNKSSSFRVAAIY